MLTEALTLSWRPPPEWKLPIGKLRGEKSRGAPRTGRKERERGTNLDSRKINIFEKGLKEFWIDLTVVAVMVINGTDGVVLWKTEAGRLYRQATDSGSLRRTYPAPKSRPVLKDCDYG